MTKNLKRVQSSSRGPPWWRRLQGAAEKVRPQRLPCPQPGQLYVASTTSPLVGVKSDLNPNQIPSQYVFTSIYACVISQT